MLERYARPNRFEIDLEAIACCVREVRRTIGPDVRFFATLKSNAYGYGLLPAARTVLASGADALSLVSLDDAIRLRRAGIESPILVYAGTVPGKAVVKAVERYELIPTLHNAESLSAFGRYASRRIDVAVKVDVGQERIGVPAEHAVEFIKGVAEQSNLRLYILNAHPNVPKSGRAQACLEWQYRRFVAVCEAVERAGINVPLKVIASSRILRMTGRSMVLNAVDPGAGLFSPLQPGDEPCQPFRSLKSRLIQVGNVSRTEFLEEAPFEIVPDMRAGIIPIGYSDGLHRLHCGEVLVRGARVPILGSPNLEYTRIDLTGVRDAVVGDEVVIIGRQKTARISPEEVAEKQRIARVPDLALEVKSTIPRIYIGPSRGASEAGSRIPKTARRSSPQLEKGDT